MVRINVVECRTPLKTVGGFRWVGEKIVLYLFGILFLRRIVLWKGYYTQSDLSVKHYLLP
jgi:hypothetical protein